MPTLEEGEGEVENVRVVVRVRPMSEKEIAQGYRKITEVDTVNGTISVENPDAAEGEPPKTFTFDVVFDTDSGQLDVYNEIARPIVNKVLMGYNGTILAYGQTGTGKTYTMEGKSTAPELKGIIPNSFAHIFGFIAKATEHTKFLVRVSHIEIYNEEVRDLLSKERGVNLEVKERPDVGVFIKNLSSYVVNNADDMDRVMTLGNKNRIVGSTAMNETSSRSHAIFTITIENGETEEAYGEEPHIKMGKLHLVDLAGSERQSKTGATGLRLKEATKINLSLSTLGNVISALVDGKSTHIPYRNSKLTRLLQDSLGGNSKTVMCANVGPADYNYEETISTLRYANRAKNIRNRARVNENPMDALLRQFQNEILELRKKLEDMGITNPDQVAVEAAEASEGDTTEREDSSKDESSRRKKNNNLFSMDDLENKDEETEDIAKKETRDGDKPDLELKKTQTERETLREKLNSMEKKILVGGENLLEKADVQEQLLESAARELEQRRRKEDQLKQALEQKEAELVDIEERYSSLQEEVTGKTKKLKKVFGMMMSAKAELSDLRHEQHREMEGLLDSVRSLSKEIKLQDAIIDHFIPEDYQRKLEQFMHWNDDIGEWQLKCVAYTGNNMRKQLPSLAAGLGREYEQPDLSTVYLSYTSDQLTGSVRSQRRHSGALTRGRSAHRYDRPKTHTS